MIVLADPVGSIASGTDVAELIAGHLLKLNLIGFRGFRAGGTAAATASSLGSLASDRPGRTDASLPIVGMGNRIDNHSIQGIEYIARSLVI